MATVFRSAGRSATSPKGYVVSDNIIRNAGLDGIKVHQATDFTFQGNVIQNAGIGNGGNHDGGIDFVAVTNSAVMGNAVVRTGGNSCLMLKGGTARNRISGNSFVGCKDAIHVGGFTDKSIHTRTSSFPRV
jgi:nitrous oxidase accessory protein NosD